MNRLYSLILAIALLLCIPDFSSAQSLDGINLVTSQADKSGKKLSLTIWGDTKGSTLYLGCSFYPAQCGNRLKEGSHDISVVNDAFSRTWDISEKYFEGSFEIALWGKKIMKNACKRSSCFTCEKFGYHPEKMLDTCSGTLMPIGSACMKICISEAGDSYMITTEGEISSGSAWLGTSFYPEKCRDIYNEGLHESRSIERNYREVFKLPRKFKNGRFEIALWKKKVARNACTLKACPWCEKMGYHLWWLIFMKSGDIVTVKETRLHQ